MSKDVVLKVLSNEKLVDNVYRMVLEGDTSAITAAGQFINIKVEGVFLRRPISICDYDDSTITIIYKTVGKGTIIMKDIEVGSKLQVLVGLGNGFKLQDDEVQVVIGGGVGVPPMYRVAKELIANGKKVTAVLGFNTKSEVFYEEEFKKLGCDVVVTTVDGSYGTQGFVTNALNELTFTHYYTCGPKPMLKAIHKGNYGKGQLSFEEKMGCGFGACMGCTCKTLYGNKRICVDGPVLESEEVLWED